MDTSISGQRVVRILDSIAKYRSLPRMIRMDCGPKFTSLALDAWARVVV
ncbi:transposase family protein [Nitrosospira sp. Nsp11]|nr:transposase family protein [Nitrosospira sp. Nsp11]